MVILSKANSRRFLSSEAFKKLRQVCVEELSLEVSEFEHLNTGALFYHLEHASADAFSIGFRTLPDDSTGLPHILEHTALCGSEAFPVRDPFFKMLNRSLAVYMNAWTGSDFTQYPFVTENSADYDNLRRIYLDAVFKPLLLKDDFLQEGWRLLPPKQKGDPIQLGGVVYNEMKGALSDADSFFLTRFQQFRFGPKSVYGVVSGGDPMEIPKLTHRDLVSFHAKCYHPSNSVTVSSGKQPVEDNLKALEDYFKNYNRINYDLTSLKAKVLDETQPRRVEKFGPIDPIGDPNSQIRLLVSFMANDAADWNESFALKILSELLFEGPASPFYRALIDSGLGSEYAPGTGYDSSTNQATISVGLQGLHESKLTLVEETIDRVFRDVRKDPEAFISRDRLETVLHQVELGLRYSSANFGLSLVSSVTQSWIHGADPISALSIAKKVATFREKYEKGGLFESLLDRYILGDKKTSRLLFIMRPDQQHASKLESHEKQFISSLNLIDDSPKMLEIVSDSERLRQKQEEEQDLSCLPCLKIDQVSPEIRDKALKPEKSEIFELYERKCTEANGLVYFKAALRLSNNLTDRQLLLLPLLLQCLSELGGAKRNCAADFDSAIKRHTGGLGFSLHQGQVKYPNFDAEMNLIVSSYGLEVNSSKMLKLLKETLTDCNLLGDRDRIKTLLNSSAAALSSSIASSGNRFASLKAASAFASPRALISEKLNGLEQAHFLNELVNEPIDKIAEELDELRKCLLEQGKEHHKVALIHSNVSESFKSLDIATFLSSLNGLKGKQASSSLNLNLRADPEADENSALFVPGPFSSNFTALALFPFKNERPSAHESAALTITARLLRSKYLHREIREKGGAYGSTAGFSSLSGIFTFSSYRDPSPLNSLNVFQSASEALLTRDPPNEEDLLGAKLSVFSDLDGPVDVSSRGLEEFLYGPQLGSDSRRQEYREALRSCSLQSVNAALETLKNTNYSSDGRVCVIGEESKIDEFKKDDKIKWKISI